ncbi:hypothetical protein WA026_013759 [Henosepilachna vigintioctopunctata]|uniref:cystathionine gamma-lyase n=1 Tax=Henosepilachna vigintioctopunctata TaxID=420089 RepID=A0AAW1V1Z2_9CUCU
MSDNIGYLPLPKSFATTAIHNAQEPEQWSCNEVVPPISMTTVFKLSFNEEDSPGSHKYKYGRFGNPTRNVLEEVIAKLECGYSASCFGSGLGASMTILGLLKQGDHLVSVDDVYGGTNILFSNVANKFGIETTFSEIDVESFEKALRPNTKMIWIESPTNPTMKICDIEAISKLAKKHDIILVVDNTFLTPYLQRPLTLGADIVIHSLTKYMNGHSDVIMGAVVAKNEKLAKEIAVLQGSMGIIPSPFDCYQVLRSLKTLALRMNQHSQSALKIAEHFDKHPKVLKVLHPGLPSHPQHELAKKQTSGHSGILSLYIDGNLESSLKFLRSLKIFALAGSLGGYESLAALPSIMSHEFVPQEQKSKLGITDNLIRLSVGLEDTDDLIADLENAFNLI